MGIAQVAVQATARTSVCKSLVAHGRAATVAVIGVIPISAAFIGILRTSAKTRSATTVSAAGVVTTAMLILSVANTLTSPAYTHRAMISQRVTYHDAAGRGLYG